MKKIVIFLFVFATLTTLYSQNPEWVNFVSKYAEGVADDGENIWIAGAGLVKINKTTNELTTFNHINTGLLTNYTTCIKASKLNKNELWIGTRTQGLAKYDGENWIYFSEKNGNFPTDFVNSIETDSSGRVYAGTIFEGLGILENGFWFFYNENNLGFQIGSIEEIVFRNGVVWLCDLNDIYKIENDIWTRYNLEDYDVPNCGITAMDVDHYGNVWFGDGCGNLNKFDGKTWTNLTEFEELVPQNSAMDIFCKDDSVFIGTEKGLILYNGTDFTVFNKENTIMKQEYIASVLVDENNIKWLTSIDSGVYKYDNNTWYEFPKYNSDLPYLDVYDIRIDEFNNKWMLTVDELTKFDGHLWEYYKYNENNPNFYGTEFNAFSIDSKGNIWAIGMMGIYKY